MSRSMEGSCLHSFTSYAICSNTSNKEKIIDFRSFRFGLLAACLYHLSSFLLFLSSDHSKVVLIAHISIRDRCPWYFTIFHSHFSYYVAICPIFLYILFLFQPTSVIFTFSSTFQAYFSYPIRFLSAFVSTFLVFFFTFYCYPSIDSFSMAFAPSMFILRIDPSFIPVSSFSLPCLQCNSCHTL